jgi:hypothetical protein
MGRGESRARANAVRRAVTLAALSFSLAGATGTDTRPVEVIELEPPENIQWGLRNVGAGITSLFGMWNYWYKDISTTVDTVPADAALEIFYIRQNFQKQFVRATPPVRLTMPSRIRTTDRDAIILRAIASGYKIEEKTYDVHELPPQIMVQLAPLPNALTFVGYTHIGGRGTMTLRTTKEAQLRVMKSRGEPGFTLALTETANQIKDTVAISGGQVDGVEISQVGEDLLVKVRTREEGIEVRSRTRFDGVRQEHVYALDFVQPGDRPPSGDEIRRELERVSLPPAGECRSRFEAALRDGIDPEQLARSQRSSGSVADLYRREAMLRVGREEQGRVRLASGETLRTGDPLELELALQSAAQVSGYLSLLAAYARTQPDPAVALRTLLAPEIAPEEFARIYERAEAVRAGCG